VRLLRLPNPPSPYGRVARLALARPPWGKPLREPNCRLPGPRLAYLPPFAPGNTRRGAAGANPSESVNLPKPANRYKHCEP
jgi:hypothetical protein